MSSVIYFLYKKEYIEETKRKLKELGYKNKIEVVPFLFIRLILELILFLLLILLPSYGFVISILSVFFFHFLYNDLLLNSKRVTRKKELEKDYEEFITYFLLALKSNNSIRIDLENIVNASDTLLTKEIKYHLKYQEVSKVLEETSKSISSPRVKELLDHLKNSNTKEEYINILEEEFYRVKKNKETKLNHRMNVLPWKMFLVMTLFLLLSITLIIVVPKYL